LPINHGLEAHATGDSISLAFEFVAKGNRFLFHADSVHDGNDGTCLEYKSGQHGAELVNGQRVVAIQHHIPAPVTHSYYKQLDLEIAGRFPLGENLQNALLGVLIFYR
jgi:hypothetical protein